MVRKIIPAISLIFLLGSCTALKQFGLAGNKQLAPSLAAPSVPKAKFIEQIVVTPQSTVDHTALNADKPATLYHPESTELTGINDGVKETEMLNLLLEKPASKVEMASPVQLKYALLLDTEVESLPSKSLLETVDEWYGVRYRRGGNTKTGVDCSGFTSAVYAAVYGITIPRVSREQYRVSQKISLTELEEGDLLFFNTTGRGVSHVAVYLGNSRFIHASVSKGVMVNSIFENYYVRRLIGAGRIEEKQEVATH